MGPQRSTQKYHNVSLHFFPALKVRSWISDNMRAAALLLCHLFFVSLCSADVRNNCVQYAATLHLLG